MIKLSSDASAYEIVSTVEHIEISIAFEFGEGDDLAALFRHQSAAMDHPRMPDFSVRKLGRPSVDLFLGIVFQISRMYRFIKKTSDRGNIASTVGANQHCRSPDQ